MCFSRFKCEFERVGLFWKNVQELQKSTQEKTGKMEEKGFTFLQVYKCQWKKVLKQPYISAIVKTIKSV